MQNLDVLLEKISTYNTLLNAIDPAFKEAHLDRFRLSFTQHSTAIEGNRCSYNDVSLIVHDDTPPRGKTLHEIYEIKGNDMAFDLLTDYARLKLSVSEDIICALHEKVLFYVKGAGHYRDKEVYVKGADTDVSEAKLVYQHMKFFIDDLNTKTFSNPLQKASFVHCQFVKIHPFIDGNGRTARLITNLSLLNDDFPMVLISNDHRSDYIDAIRDYCQTQSTSKFELFLFKTLNTQLDNFIAHYSRYN